jgi:hypothetical protein
MSNLIQQEQEERWYEEGLEIAQLNRLYRALSGICLQLVMSLV